MPIFWEAKGGGVVCLEEGMNNKLLSEVREVMFNEEFRAVLTSEFIFD